jgi:hypothetical protein
MVWGKNHMRAKIVFKSDKPVSEIKARLQAANWMPEQDTPLASEIKADIMEAVALEHKQAALAGYQFVVYDFATEARGILCHNDNEYTVRLKNKDVLSLQASAQHLIEDFQDLPTTPVGGIAFQPIQILEKGVRIPMMEGHLLRDTAEKVVYARIEKFVEYRTFRYAALISLILMAATLGNSFFGHDYWKDVKFGAQVEWLFDILAKLVGSSVMTAIISYINYHAFLKSLDHGVIRWQIPKVKDTPK